MGTLNEDVWDRAVRDGKIDGRRVRVFYTTPGYSDYNWTVSPELDRIHGEGFADRLRVALLALNPQENGEILDLFNTQRFIESSNANYKEIEAVARDLGIVR